MENTSVAEYEIHAAAIRQTLSRLPGNANSTYVKGLQQQLAAYEEIIKNAQGE